MNLQARSVAIAGARRSTTSSAGLAAAISAAVAASVIGLAYAGAPAAAGIFAGAALVAWWAVIIGLVARMWPGAAPPRAAVVAGSCLAGLALLSAVSMLWAEDPARALTEVVRICAYLGLFILVALSAPRTGPRPWLAGIALGLVAVAALALASRVAPGLFGDPESDLLGQSLGRLSYPLGYWNGLAACMAVAVVLLAWFGSVARTRAARALATGAIPLAVLVIYLASSRGGAVAALVGLGVLVAVSRGRVPLLASALIGGALGVGLSLFASSLADLLQGAGAGSSRSEGVQLALATVAAMALAAGLRRAIGGREPRPSISRRAVVAGGLALLAAGAVALAVAGPGSLVDRIDVQEEAEDGATGPAGDIVRGGSSYRTDLWGSALDAFASEPLGGVGAGSWGLYWNANNSIEIVVTRAHSLYLETLAELGVAGLALVIGFLVAPAWRWRRGSGSAAAVDAGVAPALALLAAGVTSLALDWTWDVPAATAPMVVAAALLAGGAAASAGSGSRRRPGGAYGLGVATIAFAWAVIWACGIVVLGEAKLDDSRDAAGAGNLDAAVADAEDAATIQPWSPEPPLALARAHELRGDFEAARVAAIEAIDDAPGDFRGWIFAARAEAALGDEETANLALERARQLSPRPIPVNLVFAE